MVKKVVVYQKHLQKRKWDYKSIVIETRLFKLRKKRVHSICVHVFAEEEGKGITKREALEQIKQQIRKRRDHNESNVLWTFCSRN